jgi:hypothetical protein
VARTRLQGGAAVHDAPRCRMDGRSREGFFKSDRSGSACKGGGKVARHLIRAATATIASTLANQFAVRRSISCSSLVAILNHRRRDVVG